MYLIYTGYGEKLFKVETSRQRETYARARLLISVLTGILLTPVLLMLMGQLMLLL